MGMRESKKQVMGAGSWDLKTTTIKQTNNNTATEERTSETNQKLKNQKVTDNEQWYSDF